eukprot:1161739-Pelagomonas_calceolata.AAC.9
MSPEEGIWGKHGVNNGDIETGDIETHRSDCGQVNNKTRRRGALCLDTEEFSKEWSECLQGKLQFTQQHVSKALMIHGYVDTSASSMLSQTLKPVITMQETPDWDMHVAD